MGLQGGYDEVFWLVSSQYGFGSISGFDESWIKKLNILFMRFGEGIRNSGKRNLCFEEKFN